MNVSSYRTIESWIDSVLQESYSDHGHMEYFPDGRFNDSNQWGIVLSFGAYASNLDQSNDETISAAMLKRYPRESMIVCPVFKVSGLWVKLKTKRGKATQAAMHIYDILYSLETRYCVYDSDDLQTREYEQQIESIEYIIGGYLADNAPNNYAQLIFSWLWDNDQESIITEDKAYCDDLGVFCAAIALGFIDDSDPDDIPVPSYILREFDQWVSNSFNRSKRF